jgi:hypothetical protein
VCFTIENPNITLEPAVNLNYYGAIHSRGMLGSFFFQTTITGSAYLIILEDCINILFFNKEYYFQHDGIPLHENTVMRYFLDVHFPGRSRG